MIQIYLSLSANLQRKAGFSGEVSILCRDTIGSAIQEALDRYPNLGELVYNENGFIRPFIRVSLNQKILPPTSIENFNAILDLPLSPGDRLRVISAMAGG